MPHKKAFDFLNILEPPPKPRKTGVVEIRGPYYGAVTYTYLKDLFEMVGDYVDGLKYAGGSFRLMPESVVKKTIALAHKHDIYVSTGGAVERVILQGPKAVDQYFKECKKLGFDVVEISSGFAEISLEDQLAMVRAVHKLGMKPKPEISLVSGAGGGTEAHGYKVKERGLEHMFTEIDAHIKAGADIIMIESEGITEFPGDPGPEKWRTDVIHALVKKFGPERFMFEAAEPQVFKWYLKTFGPKMNLFIDHSQIVEFAAWRTGLWGDPDIWKGKKIHYK